MKIRNYLYRHAPPPPTVITDLHLLDVYSSLSIFPQWPNFHSTRSSFP